MNICVSNSTVFKSSRRNLLCFAHFIIFICIHTENVCVKRRWSYSTFLFLFVLAPPPLRCKEEVNPDLEKTEEVSQFEDICKAAVDNGMTDMAMIGNYIHIY